MDLNYHIRNLTPDEFHIPIEWARIEGWNPGIHDAESHYPVDPSGWFCAELNGEIIGTVVATNYNDSFSFGGFYIVNEKFRDHGVGLSLIQLMYSHVGDRNFGIDGVYEMESKYNNKMGMKYAYRNIRWKGIASGKEQCDLIPATDVPFDELLRYDTVHFPAERRIFLERWIRQPEGTSLVKLHNNGNISGFGVIRKCFEGYKIGPIFADNPEIADEIYEGLTSSIPGETVFFDTPEPNTAAVRMAEKRAMVEVFGTARMYSKEIPNLPIQEIFGVTTFELG